MASAYGARSVVFLTLRGRASVLGRSSLKDEVVVTSWHSRVSGNPALYLVALSVRGSHALALIRDSRVFVVNFVSDSLKDAAVEASHHAGEFVDKFGHAGLSVSQALRVDVPRLRDALSWIECELVQEFVLGDHVCFVGKVVYEVVVDAVSPRLMSDDFMDVPRS